MSIVTRTSALLKNFGAPVVISRESGGAVDPVTGKRAASTVETLTSYGLATQDRKELANAFRGVSDDSVMLILDTTNKPQIGDNLAYQEQVYSIKQYDIQYFKNVPVYYIVKLVK